MTTNAPSSAKRMTSKSSQQLVFNNNEKRTRITTMAEDDAADAAALDSNDAAAALELFDDDEDDDEVGGAAVPAAVVATSHRPSSSTGSGCGGDEEGEEDSSLSDDNNNCPDDDDEMEGDAKGGGLEEDDEDDDDVAMKDTIIAGGKNATMKRQVSNDDSMIEGSAGHGASALAAAAAAAARGSGGSGARDSSFTSDRDNSLGNWGWFEDVHGNADGNSAFLPSSSQDGNTNSSKERGGVGGGTGGGGAGGAGGGKKKNGANGDEDGSGDHSNSGKNNSDNKNNKNDRKTMRGGLFHIGSEVMQNVMAMVDPHREVMNTMAVTAPTYVLEESLSSQKLWKHTAGNRPPQPVEERAFFEQMWAQNFARSQVKYEIPVEVLTASTPISISPFNDDRYADDGGPGGANLSNYNLAAPFNLKNVGDDHAVGADPASVKAAQADVAEATLNQHLNVNGAVEMYFDPNRPKDYNLKTLGPHHHHHTWVNKKVKGVGNDNDLTVVVRGDNVFGTTVSKSFPRVNDKGEQLDGIDTVSISIASYRVVESKKLGKYAQFLVIFCDGNFRNTVGVWKRYSDFSELSRKVTHGHSESCAAVVTGLNPLSVTDDHDVEILPNAITSWKLLKKRQRWYRCLDAGYLSLKVFLLERFLHDILFESSNPQILRDFVGVNSSESSKLNTKG